MKKNISINISGIIFHIEEDGYDTLKKYLDSINRYFSTFEDSHEIIADIEGRIAEIFLNRLKDGKQVISKDDVENLIATMGSVKDFQAFEEETAYISEEKEPKKEKKFQAPPIGETRKLQRDGKRKILGGVLSGIAHYLSIDPMWVRLIYLLLFFGISITESIGPILFIVYIALWIIFPVSYDLEEEEKLKKMYRDPDAKVLGGVCSGIAAYFGIDVVIVRLLFFISIFFAGTGIFLYIILWLILPEAITITDKMKMKGQPVTLSNIEMNIKKSFNVKEGEENLFLKILLFPFRVIAVVLEFISKAIGPLLRFVVEAARILAGVILVLAGFAVLVAVLIGVGAVVGVLNAGEYMHVDQFPIFLIQNDLGWGDLAGLFFALAIPMIFLIILGVIVISKSKVITASIGWVMLGLWFVSLVLMGVKIPGIVRDFSQQGRFVETEEFEPAGQTLMLTMQENNTFDYDVADLSIKEAEGDKIEISKEYRARGKDVLAAEKNAQMIYYNISKQDSVLVFDSNVSFRKDARFRAQQLSVTVNIPEGQRFMVDQRLKFLFGSFFRRRGYGDHDLNKTVWYFENGMLQCVGCGRKDEARQSETRERESTGYLDEQKFDLADFEEIEIRGTFNVKIAQSKNYEVILREPANTPDDGIVVEKRGDRLSIRANTDAYSDGDDAPYLDIYMPELSRLELRGHSRVNVDGFRNKSLVLTLRDASVVDFDGHVDDVNMRLSGSSSVSMFGKGKLVKAYVENSSKLNAVDFYVDEADIEAVHSAEVQVYSEKRLKILAREGSRVVYRGDARVEIEKKAGATVEQY